MTRGLACFTAYDIRGRVPAELNEDIAWRIGRAYADLLRPRTVVVGHDVRLSSPALSVALTRGLTDSGVDVIDIGLCGTEQVYFGHTHQALAAYQHGNVLFHNPGAPMAGLDFGIVEVA